MTNSNVFLTQLFPFFNIILGLFTNGLLIFLIVKKSPKMMANYKYLMIIFSILEIFFALVDMINQPMLHFYKSGYIIFSLNNFGLPQYLSAIFIAFNCSVFAMVIYLLSFQFIYRYFAVCRPHLLYLFNYPHYFIFLFVHMFISLEWWISTCIVSGVNSDKNEFWRVTMFETFGFNIEEVTYISSVLMVIGNNNFSLPDIILLIKLLVTILIGFNIILFFGLKIQREISADNKTSRRTCEMQHQLFHALIAQTIIPSIFMFIPASFLLLVPLIQVNVGFLEHFIIPAIRMYPIFDSLSTMYLIKPYRNSVYHIFCKNNNLVRRNVSVTTIHAVL